MNKVIQLGGSAAFIPTFENAAYGIEWTKDDNDIIRIGNAKFHRELPIQNRLKGCVYNEKKISYFLNPTGWAKPLENGLIPPKKCIRKKIKDKDFLMILDEIIDSTDNVRDVSSKLTNKIGIGVPIGNYLSQYFANLYLSELDHLCKEELKCKFYYRYADDIIILSDDKDFLHKVLIYIKLYVHTIGLKVKDNYQIYPVDSRGINFVGYVFYHTHTLIRKSIKYKIIRLVNSYLNREIDKKEFKVRMCAYYGWLKHADAKNLLYKIQSLTGVRYSNWNGKRTNIAKYYGKYVRIIQIINYAKYFRINFIKNGKAYYADSRDKTLFYSIHRLNHFPINFKITKYDWRIYTKNRKEKVKPQT